MILQADNKEKLNKKDIDSVNSTQLNISGLSVSYSDSTVLENVTLQLKKGEILGIAGESGSGKSTLIKAIIGLFPKEGHIDGGVIEYNGVDITGNEKCLKSLRGSNIGMIFQNTERAMCPVRTIKSQLNISGLSVSYSDSTVLENVTLQLKKGEILGIAGESGSGKSTLIKAIIGLFPKEGHIDGGVIEYNGVDITGNEKCLKSLRGSNIGMIFQNTERAMCPVRTIKSQLYESIFSNEAVKDKRKAKRIIDEKAVHMLEQMNIKNAIKVLNSYPFELSGGMNQRVGIMMAMLMKPDLLLADEPTSALDVIAQRQVVDIFKDIKCSGDTSMIIVSHNINVVRELADKIIVMKSGRIVEYEDTEIIMNYPKQEYTKQLISAVPVLRRECADEYNIRA